MLLVGNSESIQDFGEVLFLVEVDCPVLSVTSDSYSEDLINLPQILGVESP